MIPRMRRLLALGCALAYLAFSVVAGAAHVHEAAGHHDEMRGLHLDHTHVGDVSRDPSGHDHHHAPSEDSRPRIEGRHVDHHEGDALYLAMTAQRALDSGLRVLPAMIAVGATMEPSSRTSTSRDETPRHLRGPPQRRLTPSRAPPA